MMKGASFAVRTGDSNPRTNRGQTLTRVISTMDGTQFASQNRLIPVLEITVCVDSFDSADLQASCMVAVVEIVVSHHEPKLGLIHASVVVPSCTKCCKQKMLKMLLIKEGKILHSVSRNGLYKLFT